MTAIDMNAKRQRAQQEPGDVDAAPLAVRRLGHEDGGQDERHDPEAQVEPEDGPPAGEPDQQRPR